MEGETQNETPRYDGPKTITVQAKILCAIDTRLSSDADSKKIVQEGGKRVEWRARVRGGGTYSMIQTWV